MGGGALRAAHDRTRCGPSAAGSPAPVGSNIAALARHRHGRGDPGRDPRLRRHPDLDLHLRQLGDDGGRGADHPRRPHRVPHPAGAAGRHRHPEPGPPGAAGSRPPTGADHGGHGAAAAGAADAAARPGRDRPARVAPAAAGRLARRRGGGDPAGAGQARPPRLPRRRPNPLRRSSRPPSRSPRPRPIPHRRPSPIRHRSRPPLWRRPHRFPRRPRPRRPSRPTRSRRC